ncbi:unnamed protein product, partial [Meganyctiphanes norvegica]
MPKDDKDKEYKPSHKSAIGKLFTKKQTRATSNQSKIESQKQNLAKKPKVHNWGSTQSLPTTSFQALLESAQTSEGAAQITSSSEDLTNLTSQVIEEVDINTAAMVEESIRAMQQSFKEIALSTKQNDMRTVYDMPHFGPGDQTGKNWVLDSCPEFLEYIDKITGDNTSWNDKGRIKVLRTKLIGPARGYFNDFTGDTWAEAKTYLLNMFPDATTYASCQTDIDKLKRKPGEQLSYFAIRISKLHAKLKKVSPDSLTPEWLERQKKELLVKHLPSSCRNFVSIEKDTYEELLKKLLDYFELNSQHKLTKGDIEGERERGVKGVSAVKESSNGSEKQNGTKTKTQNKEEQGVTEGAVAALGQRKPFQKSNKDQNSTSKQEGQNTQRNYQNYRGNTRGGRGGYRGGYNSGYSYRGSRNYQRDYRGRGS